MWTPLLSIITVAVAANAQQSGRDGSSGSLLANGATTTSKSVYKLEGPNVCRKLQRTPKTVTVPERTPVSVRKTTWCAQFPPRCENVETVYRMLYVTKTEYIEEMIDACCSGYHESAGQCVPFCAQCYHGRCSRPDVCECEPGYSGPTCSNNCPRDRWGPSCQRSCSCLNGAKCDAYDGVCECSPGWRGANCSEPCAPLHYGHMCMLQCRCLNGAECDHISGECKCQTDFCGPLCERREPNCHAGETRACEKCQNGGKCRRKDNSCDCPAGWTGEVCANPCPIGKWGDNCRSDCPVCYNNGTCDAVTGSCRCPAGFQGRQCQMQCMKGFYGANCDRVCKCENGAECDFDTGQCQCTPGFSGEFCQVRACPAGRFDPPLCDKKCTCGNATLCHPLSGACTCSAGWRNNLGDACCTCCILNSEDTSCLHRCKCMDRKFLCDPDLDGCVCMPWYKGTPDECSALITSSSLSRARAVDDAALVAGQHNGGGGAGNDGSSISILVAIIAAVLLVLLAAFLFIFYRRRRMRAVKYADADFSVTYSQGSQFNLHENPRQNSVPGGVMPSLSVRSDSIADNPNYSGVGSVIAEAPAFRNAGTASDVLSRASSAAPSSSSYIASAASSSSAQPVFHGVTADVPNNKRTLPRKITNIERVKLGPLTEDEYRVPVPKSTSTPFEASAAEAKARHLMQLGRAAHFGGSSSVAAGGAVSSNNSLASGAYEDIDESLAAPSNRTYAPQSSTTQFAVGGRGAASSIAADSEHPYSTIDDDVPGSPVALRLQQQHNLAQNSTYFDSSPPKVGGTFDRNAFKGATLTNEMQSEWQRLSSADDNAAPRSSINPFGSDDFSTQMPSKALPKSMPKPLSPKRFS